MRALRLEAPGKPLAEVDLPFPTPGPGQVVVRVTACGVCRTDLHIVDGELPTTRLPIVPGHEVVGRVERVGDGVDGLCPGQRVGIPWLGWSCGQCRYCRMGKENLCDEAQFTGYDLDGGYAEAIVADARYAFPLPGSTDDLHMAPLLCAGLIGHRTLRMAGEAEVLGLYGFGAAAHIVAQVALREGRRVLAFTRPGDRAAQEFARSLGLEWAGGSDESPPLPLDAALLFAPVGALVPRALAAVRKGGVVVAGGIHMSDIPSFPYELLWGERCVRSVANLTREDAREFLSFAPGIVETRVRPFPLNRANEALRTLRSGELVGAAVLVPGRLEGENA